MNRIAVVSLAASPLFAVDIDMATLIAESSHGAISVVPRILVI